MSHSDWLMYTIEDDQLSTKNNQKLELPLNLTRLLFVGTGINITYNILHKCYHLQ